MKGLRVFLIVVISVVLVFLISFVTVVSTVKKTLEGPILKEALKSTVKNEISGFKEEQIVEIDKILDSEETGDIIDSVLDEYVKYMDGETNEIGDQTIDILFDFIRKHKADIEKITGEEIDLNEIDTPENREDFKKSLNEGLEDLKKQENSEVNFAIKTYAKITSKRFLVKMICVICALIVIIGLLSWSLYKWLLPVGIVFIVSGVLSGILFVISLFANAILKSSTDVGFSLDYKFLLIIFLSELVGGIVFVVIQNILNKKFIKEKNEQLLNN